MCIIVKSDRNMEENKAGKRERRVLGLQFKSEEEMVGEDPLENEKQLNTSQGR